MKINAKMKKKIAKWKVNSEWIKFNKFCFFFFENHFNDIANDFIASFQNFKF